jgi:hypothetical protein
MPPTWKEEEVENLARAEHHRWCEERRCAGWQFGPVKDVIKKVSPFLKDFDELPDDAKQPGADQVSLGVGDAVKAEGYRKFLKFIDLPKHE